MLIGVRLADDPNADLNSSIMIGVRWFPFDKKTILGTRAQLDFRQIDSFLGATALILQSVNYESKR